MFTLFNFFFLIYFHFHFCFAVFSQESTRSPADVHVACQPRVRASDLAGSVEHPTTTTAAATAAAVCSHERAHSVASAQLLRSVARRTGLGERAAVRLGVVECRCRRLRRRYCCCHGRHRPVAKRWWCSWRQWRCWQRAELWQFRLACPHAGHQLAEHGQQRQHQLLLHSTTTTTATAAAVGSVAVHELTSTSVCNGRTGLGGRSASPTTTSTATTVTTAAAAFSTRRLLDSVAGQLHR